jgi:hypothetical protein
VARVTTTRSNEISIIMETDTHSQFTDEPSLDTVFALLRNPQRRNVVSLLADTPFPVSLEDLAAAVVTWESEAHGDETALGQADQIPRDGAGNVPSAKADAAAVRLHHVHLPKLDDTGVLTYDAEAKTVTAVRVETVAPVSNLLGSMGVVDETRVGDGT